MRKIFVSPSFRYLGQRLLTNSDLLKIRHPPPKSQSNHQLFHYSINTINPINQIRPFSICINDLTSQLPQQQIIKDREHFYSELQRNGFFDPNGGHLYKMGCYILANDLNNLTQEESFMIRNFILDPDVIDSTVNYLFKICDYNNYGSFHLSVLNYVLSCINKSELTKLDRLHFRFLDKDHTGYLDRKKITELYKILSHANHIVSHLKIKNDPTRNINDPNHAQILRIHNQGYQNLCHLLDLPMNQRLLMHRIQQFLQIDSDKVHFHDFKRLLNNISKNSSVKEFLDYVTHCAYLYDNIVCKNYQEFEQFFFTINSFHNFEQSMNFFESFLKIFPVFSSSDSTDQSNALLKSTIKNPDFIDYFQNYLYNVLKSFHKQPFSLIFYSDIHALLYFVKNHDPFIYEIFFRYYSSTVETCIDATGLAMLICDVMEFNFYICDNDNKLNVDKAIMNISSILSQKSVLDFIVSEAQVCLEVPRETETFVLSEFIQLIQSQQFINSCLLFIKKCLDDHHNQHIQKD